MEGYVSPFDMQEPMGNYVLDVYDEIGTVLCFFTDERALLLATMS